LKKKEGTISMSALTKNSLVFSAFLNKNMASYQSRKLYKTTPTI